MEEGVIVLRRIERRVKVDEVNGFGGDMIAQNVQVVAEE